MSTASPLCSSARPVCPAAPPPRLEWRRWLDLVQACCTPRLPVDSPFTSPAHTRLEGHTFLGGHVRRWSAK